MSELTILVLCERPLYTHVMGVMHNLSVEGTGRQPLTKAKLSNLLRDMYGHTQEEIDECVSILTKAGYVIDLPVAGYWLPNKKYKAAFEGAGDKVSEELTAFLFNAL